VTLLRCLTVWRLEQVHQQEIGIARRLAVRSLEEVSVVGLDHQSVHRYHSLPSGFGPGPIGVVLPPADVYVLPTDGTAQ